MAWRFYNSEGKIQSAVGYVLPAVPANYTVSNDSTDRTFDANATSLNELSDIVATIIADLITEGIFQ